MSIIDNNAARTGRASLRQKEALYSDMFHVSPVSAWHLDASAARDIFSALRADGVTDLLSHAHIHPIFVRSIMQALRVEDVNQETLALFGVPASGDIIGGSLEPFWYVDDCETFLSCINASFRGITCARGETRMRTFDGRSIDVVFTMSASRELQAAGQMLVTIVDISNRVRAEAALAEMRVSYTHFGRVAVLGELTATIAHEINQPLGAITINGEASLNWLKSDKIDVVELRSALEDIVSDARRASDIIGNIKMLAVPVVAKSSNLSFNDLVKGSVAFLRHELKKANVDAIVTLQRNLPEILGAPIQLQQVIVNLILNAAQAMEGSTYKRLELETMATLEGHVCLEVRDSGHGISVADLPRVFDRFFTTKPSGMGIGLAICRSIVEDHQGAISLENAVAGGATVTLTLPASHI